MGINREEDLLSQVVKLHVDCGEISFEESVVDSGYESEENYHYVNESEQLSLFVKPSNHEQKKKRKYKNGILAQREAMEKKTSTEEGILLRVNRSIQTEGVF